MKPSFKDIFRGVIGRIEIEESIRPVIVPDERLKILILHDNIGHSVFKLLYQDEELSDVKGLGCKRLSTAGIAVAQKLHEHSGSADIVITSDSQAKLFQLLGLRLRQHDLRQFQLLRQIAVIKLFMLEEAPDGNKVFSGIQIAEADLPDRCHGALLHAVEQIHKISVKIVIDLEGINRRLAKKDTSRASEHIDESAVMKRKESV